jgi:hypothetical protein
MDTDLRTGLVQVPGELPTFASAGLEARAIEIGRRAAASYAYIAGLLDLRPEAQVLVVNEADWASRTDVQLYGLPNADHGTLVVAGTEAPFWAEFGVQPDEAGRAELAAVYGRPDGSLAFAPFFDLIAVHEVAHLFHEGRVIFPRLWLQEFFANLCLHAYVERREPDALETLLTLARVGARVPATAFEYRTRDEFERTYSRMSGPNYAWFQFRLQLEAAEVFRSGGEATVRRLYDAVRVDDAELSTRLTAAVDAGLGAFALQF